MILSKTITEMSLAVSWTISRSMTTTHQEFASISLPADFLLALRERKFKEDDSGHEQKDEAEVRNSAKMRHKSTIIGVISPPMKMTEQTKFNLGKVHYQLAVSKFVFLIFLF